MMQLPSASLFRRMQALCFAEEIIGYPSMRVYRDGADNVSSPDGHHRHESYRGHRTYEALEAFVDGLVPSAGPAPTSGDGMVRPEGDEEQRWHQC